MNVLLSSAAYTITDLFPASEGLTAYNIIKHLEGYDIFFYAIAGGVAIHKALKNVKLYEVKVLSPHTRVRSSLVASSTGVFYTLRNYSLSIKILRNTKIDIVHHMFPSSAMSFSFLPLLSNMHKHCPFIFGPICGLKEVPRSVVEGIGIKLHMATVRRSHAVIVQTPLLKEAYSRTVNADKIWVIPLGVDTNYFSPCKVRKEKESFEILTVASLLKAKGIDYLIKATPLVLSKHRNVRLRIIGDGPERSRLIQLVRRLNLQGKVIFEGYLPHSKLRDFYWKASVFCLPTLREAFGKVIIEAMACGKAVIATNTFGPSQIIDHMKDGIIVPSASSKALAEAILSLISDDKLRGNMEEMARRKAVKVYSWDRIAQKYHEVYTTVLR